MQQIELHRREFAAAMRLDERMVRLEIDRDIIRNQLVMVLKREVYADKIGVETITGPANWWEMLKQERAPKWFLKKYPVKTKVLAEVDGEAMFPDYVPPPCLGKHYIHYVVKRPQAYVEDYA
ncbi:hypothetical protein POK33_29425 [Burkholderia cenocepacia]|uniref:hypothetical protein n=1 Tax=Burkholderia cenocepacia TaxID=95486 RepID=UPI0023BA0F75|nr:hypothetical protein [Burkholderia cenocepacia]MDF0504860.1 hypothetical protein [Burkholderia cenocepacia]